MAIKYKIKCKTEDCQYERIISSEEYENNLNLCPNCFNDEHEIKSIIKENKTLNKR